MDDDLWVSDYMTRNVVTCPPDTSLGEVIEELRTNSFSCLVVVDVDLPIGIVTERGLLGILADLLGEKNWEQIPIDNFMTLEPTTIDEDRTLAEATTVMQAKKIKQAPIVNITGELVGILTLTDIITGFMYAHLDEEG